MHSSPCVVSTLWIGAPLSPYEQLALTSFVAAGVTVQLFTFDPLLAVPDGVERCDAREVLPETSVFQNPHFPGTHAPYSDVFRYRMLQTHGATWIDTDVVLVGSGLPAGEYLFGLEAPATISCGVLKAPAQSPFVGWLNEQVAAIDDDSPEWGVSGPRLVTEGVTRFGLQHHVQPVEVLYPIHYTDIATLFDPAARDWVDERLSDAATLHLWNEILRRGGLNKHIRPPSGSWLAGAFDMYDIRFPTDEELDFASIRSTLAESRLPVRRRLMRKLRHLSPW